MWLHLLIFTAILATDPEPELLYARPGDILPLTAVEKGSTVEASFGPGTAVPIETLRAPENGLHLLALFARDSLGNVSSPKWYLVHVDDLPPEILLTFSNQPIADAKGKWWVGPETSVQLKASDKLSGVEISWLDLNNSVLEGEQAFLNAPLSQQGAYIIKGSARDRVGNKSKALVKNIHVDLTPPKGEIKLHGIQKQLEDRLILSANTKVEAIIRDDESGLADWTPQLNGQAVAKNQWDGPWKQGVYELSATAIDQVGNSSKVGQTRFEVDTEPPVAAWEVTSQVFTNSKGVQFYRLPIELNIEAKDDTFGPCKLEYFKPEHGWFPVKGSISIDETQVSIRSVDGVGNELAQTLTWPQDHIGPRIALETKSGEKIEPGKPFHLKLGDELFPKIFDSESGISTTYFHFDDGDQKPLPDWFRFRKKDQVVLTIYAEDYLGNLSRAQYPIIVTRHGKRSNP